MAAIEKVVLIGASGVLGSAVLSALLENTSFHVTVLTRSTSNTAFSANPKLTVLRIDYDAASLTTAFENQDAVICAAGIPFVTQQPLVIDACIRAGVYRYITNDFGNPESFIGLPELEWARAPKIEVLNYAKSQAASNQGFTWTALATGHFLDYAIRKFPAFGFDIATRKARLVDGGTEPFSATVLADIGLAVAGILSHPAETANRYLTVRSLEMTQLEILAELESQTGGKWEVEHADSGELYEKGKVMMAGGEKGAILTLLPVQIFEVGKGRSTMVEDRYDNRLLGVQGRDVGEVVRNVLEGI